MWNVHVLTSKNELNGAGLEPYCLLLRIQSTPAITPARLPEPRQSNTRTAQPPDFQRTDFTTHKHASSRHLLCAIHEVRKFLTSDPVVLNKSSTLREMPAGPRTDESVIGVASHGVTKMGGSGTRCTRTFTVYKAYRHGE
jgi:hypothetical protein